MIAAGIFSLPLLSFLIDLKALEVGLHVKLISQHLKENFSDIAEIKDWEEKLWSGTKISSFRTRLTIAAAVGTSLSVLVISFLFVYLIKPQWLIFLIIVALVGILSTGLISRKIIPKLFN